jgi:hypothetical protein
MAAELARRDSPIAPSEPGLLGTRCSDKSRVMAVLRTQGAEQRDERGRWLPGTTPTGARPWRRGEAPNQTGKSGDYHEALKLARKTSMRSITRLMELRESTDEQIATVASKALWEISWGKPQAFDPKAEALEEQKNRKSFDPRQYTKEEVAQIEAALLLMIEGSKARRGAVEVILPYTE